MNPAIKKRICEQNLALMPKISFKFYSLKQETVDTNASIVTATIVDKLEKREAFRKVIKKVSEDLMKTSKVKGVKVTVNLSVPSKNKPTSVNKNSILGYNNQ